MNKSDSKSSQDMEICLQLSTQMLPREISGSWYELVYYQLIQHLSLLQSYLKPKSFTRFVEAHLYEGCYPVFSINVYTSSMKDLSSSIITGLYSTSLIIQPPKNAISIDMKSIFLLLLDQHSVIEVAYCS